MSDANQSAEDALFRLVQDVADTYGETEEAVNEFIGRLLEAPVAVQLQFLMNNYCREVAKEFLREAARRKK